MTTLRVAASDYLGEALLLPVLRRLVRRGAPLRFEITTTNSIEAARLVADGLVDVAMVSTASPARPRRRSCSAGSASTGSRPRRRRGARSRYARGSGASRCCASAPAARGGGVLDELLARLRAPPAVDDRRPQRVADAVLRAPGAGHRPGARAGAARAATAAAWRSNAPTCRRSTSAWPAARRSSEPARSRASWTGWSRRRGARPRFRPDPAAPFRPLRSHRTA